MVNLTRIYTKTGDDGTTSLGDMSRTSKNDARLEAYATVDEANSYLGVVLADKELDQEIRKLLVRIQNDLFDVRQLWTNQLMSRFAFLNLKLNT
jgi:cob(I)alamin adenosyltransferase